MKMGYYHLVIWVFSILEQIHLILLMKCVCLYVQCRYIPLYPRWYLIKRFVVVGSPILMQIHVEWTKTSWLKENNIVPSKGKNKLLNHAKSTIFALPLHLKLSRRFAHVHRSRHLRVPSDVQNTGMSKTLTALPSNNGDLMGICAVETGRIISHLSHLITSIHGPSFCEKFQYQDRVYSTTATTKLVGFLWHKTANFTKITKLHHPSPTISHFPITMLKS
jgi:hypothetical protein